MKQESPASQGGGRFNSANGVELFFETLKERDADLRILGHLRFACIGPFTEEALRKRFGGKVLTAADSSAEGIAEAICRDWKQKEKRPRERSEQ